MLSANYDPQSSPDAKPPAASTPPAATLSTYGKGSGGSNGNGNHLPSPASAASTMFPFGPSVHQTAAAAPGLSAAVDSKGGLEQQKPPTSRLDELFQSKSSQAGLSLSLPPPPQRRLVAENESDLHLPRLNSRIVRKYYTGLVGYSDTAYSDSWLE